MRGHNDTSLIRIQENAIQAFENVDLELQRLVRDRDVHALGITSTFLHKLVGTGDIVQG